MSENKFSTESAQTEAQGAAAAEELEREAKAGNDITTYTHRFSSPFTFHSITEDAIKDTTVDALTFNWGTLTGADYLAIEDEVLMHGKTLVVPAFSCAVWLSAPAPCAMRTVSVLWTRGP